MSSALSGVRPLTRLARSFSSGLAARADVQDSATARADLTKRRFWNKVTLSKAKGQAAGLTIELDGRPLKTPSGALLVVPQDRPLLASLIAREWAEQERILKSFTLPLTSLAARAIDGFATPEDREKVCDDLIKYLETDTVCYQEEEPPVLVKLQQEHWDPLISWVRSTFQVEVNPITSLLGSSQSPDTTSKLRSHISKYDSLELAAFERAVMSTKSFIIALKLLENSRNATAIEEAEEWGVEEAAQAAEVEVKSQTEKWGEVEDTHDVDHEDLRARLGSVVLGLIKDDASLSERIIDAQNAS
ncbi:ATP12-domain-containing protein [Ceraceosorus guamensis]|uniref:ATP12-domain-containing protein n=1 Tax=Ceraceosorus guamensis TaxID=1522189 RepID=A0A316W532_9BASI|nr:ATP12-domain-containing protein [Ceraceosorus guamensis]PWN44899.1 ATP12-domain-containing protein [Ceraceosorus guamensis]